MSPAGQGARAVGDRAFDEEPAVGNLATEAGRLFEALHQAAAGWSSTRAGAKAADEDGQEDGPCSHALPPTCRICPLCQVVHRLNQVRPEVLQHVADATASLAAAVSELAATRPPEPGRGPRPDVQHIDVTD